MTKLQLNLLMLLIAGMMLLVALDYVLHDVSQPIPELSDGDKRIYQRHGYGGSYNRP